MRDRSPAQIFALVFGVVYLAIGVIGFAVTGFENFAGETYQNRLLIFPLNPLHNIVHLALGAGWLVACDDHGRAKSINLVFGGALLVVFLLGMIGVLKFLAIEGPGSADNYLHLATGLLSVYFGTVGAEVDIRRR